MVFFFSFGDVIFRDMGTTGSQFNVDILKSSEVKSLIKIPVKF